MFGKGLYFSNVGGINEPCVNNTGRVTLKQDVCEKFEQAQFFFDAASLSPNNDLEILAELTNMYPETHPEKNKFSL